MRFILHRDTEGPDAVLHRFKRLIVLEQEEKGKLSIMVTNEGGFLEAGLNARINRLERRVDQAEWPLDLVVARYEQLQKEVASIQAGIGQLTLKKETLSNELKILSQQKPQTDGSDSTVAADIKRYEDRISVYEKTLGLSIKRTKQNGPNKQATLRGCCAEDVGVGDMYSHVNL